MAQEIKELIIEEGKTYTLRIVTAYPVDPNWGGGIKVIVQHENKEQLLMWYITDELLLQKWIYIYGMINMRVKGDSDKNKLFLRVTYKHGYFRLQKIYKGEKYPLQYPIERISTSKDTKKFKISFYKRSKLIGNAYMPLVEDMDVLNCLYNYSLHYNLNKTCALNRPTLQQNRAYFNKIAELNKQNAEPKRIIRTINEDVGVHHRKIEKEQIDLEYFHQFKKMMENEEFKQFVKNMIQKEE